MKKKLVAVLIILIFVTVAYAANVAWTDKTELTAIADADILLVVDDVSGTATSKKITVLNFFDTIDSFAKLNTIVTNKTLVNEEDAVTWDALGTFGLGITITTGDPFTLGTTRWDNGSDLIDGERIANDTIDNDSIDWSDMTDLTTDGAVSWGNIAEGELADSTVISADIKDDTIDSADYAPDSIDNEHINWADIDNLGDEGAVTLAATSTALATARTIAGVSFDGTGNIAIASTGLSDTADILYEAELDDLSELTTQIGDVSTFITDDIMPDASADPDVDAAGELSVDTDGGNEPNSVTLRTFMGTDDQAVLADTMKPRQFTITEPDTLAQGDFLPIWKNNTGFTFIITAISGESDIDNFDFTIKERDADGANVTTIEAVQLTTDGTAMYYGSVVFADLDHTAIEAGHTLGYDNSADDATYVQVALEGYFNADVD